jgi:tetratricopeptide (TPR) repeat protein
MFVVMAAINMAGFDYEPGGQPLSPARAELRKDLANLDPAIKAKLAAFYKAHRRPGNDEATDVNRYQALSLLMTPPPAFAVNDSSDHPLPADLAEILADKDASNNPVFLNLVRDFYAGSGIKALIPKYTAVGEAYAAAYRRPVGEIVYQTLEYFHTQPEIVINMRPFVVSSGTGTKSQGEKQTVFVRNRSRQMFVLPDPLACLNTSFGRGDILNQKEDLPTRRVGDDYIIVIGPSRVPTTEAIRQAMIRFVIDPLVERHLKASLEYKDPILKLAGSIPTVSKEYSSSVYLIIRESLAQATEARMRRIQEIATRGSYGDDDAVYDLAQAYLRGAALSFHFYGALKGLEQVGINLEDFFDQMVATTKFDREAGRAKEFEPIVAKVAAARKAKGDAPAVEPAAGSIVQKVLLSDDLIRQRKFADARTILDEILVADPNNARALYGMAQLVSQAPSAAENDPNADENDKIQAQKDRLEKAISLFRKAIQYASPESERWLIQWSHVFVGRILDFEEFRVDAIAEYEKAIALGQEVPNGAYKEAVEGKLRPFGQK